MGGCHERYSCVGPASGNAPDSACRTGVAWTLGGPAKRHRDLARADALSLGTQAHIEGQSALDRRYRLDEKAGGGRNRQAALLAAMRRILQGRRVAIGADGVEVAPCMWSRPGTLSGRHAKPGLACRTMVPITLARSRAAVRADRPQCGREDRFDEVEPCDPGPLAEAAIRSIAWV